MIRSIAYMTIGCTLLLIASVLYLAMDHPRDITIMVDGRETKIETLETSVYGVLKEAGISVRAQDEIEPALSADLPDNELIVIRPAKEITLIMGYGEAQTIRTQARRVDDLLKERGIEQMETDDIYPSKDAILTTGMTVRYREAFPLELIVEGKARSLYTYQTTVRELLAMQGIKLQPEDNVSPGLDTVVVKDMLVTVNTTRRAVLTEEQLLPFEVETIEDETLPAGEQLVTKAGRPGIRTQKYQLTLADGLSKEKKLITNKITSQPVKQVVKVGTKPVASVEAVETTPAPVFDTEKATVPLAETPKAATDLDFKKAKTLMVEATAYTNDPASNGSRLYDGRALTATGYDVTDTITYQGLPIIAVDPKVIPLGTKVYVEGVGLAIALDTGGAIKGNKIDVLVDGETTAKQFGRKTIQVWVIPNETTAEAGN
ncbi:3D domain-containing protein [Exiguobacterium antarcticum]|uniref:3D domain-containing protein n=1 Tax=Exiguobacterium antarcticum TaxID=132920 RepID=UPI000285ED00|nr:3D domain-containing protein [Exiguobacterium antarcticum]AFS69199.1 3D domain-containing protein [Exiguobacterium antarcticum B7]